MTTSFLHKVKTTISPTKPTSSASKSSTAGVAADNAQAAQAAQTAQAAQAAQAASATRRVPTALWSLAHLKSSWKQAWYSLFNSPMQTSITIMLWTSTLLALCILSLSSTAHAATGILPYEEWLTDQDNLRGLENTLRYHAVCPADMQIEVQSVENREKAEKIRGKLRRRFSEDQRKR